MGIDEQPAAVRRHRAVDRAPHQARPDVGEVVREDRPQPRRHIEDAILAALALGDADASGHEVNIGYQERRQLADPKGTVEERGHDRVVPLTAKIREGAKLREEGVDLMRLEVDRQPLRLLDRVRLGRYVALRETFVFQKSPEGDQDRAPVPHRARRFAATAEPHVVAIE